MFFILIIFRELRLNIIKSNHKFYFDRFKDVDKISYMDFKEFLLKFLKTLKIKILIQGNLTKNQALDITQNILSNMNQEAVNSKRLLHSHSHQLRLGAKYIRVKSFLSNDKNSVIKNYYQIGKASTESGCLLELLVKVMREPLFNYLRTNEQLGYSVTCSAKNDNDVLGLTITVESQEKRNSSWTVDSKIDSFLKSFSFILQQMQENDFEIMKKSILSHKRSPDTCLEIEVNRNWSEIKEGKYKFEKNDIEARQLEILTKSDLLIFFHDHFLANTMRKISVQVIANSDAEDSLLHHGYLHLDLLTDEKHNTIKNIAQFKSSLLML